MHDSLSLTFSALADPTRRAILARLKHGQASVNQLAEPFLGRMTLPGVTKHLKVLERAGLVSKGRDAQWRPRTLNVAPLKDVDSWMDEYRAHMEASLDRLGEYLKTISAVAPSNKPTTPTLSVPTPHRPNDKTTNDQT